MITVFYDGKCGLCSKEIRHYQRISPAGIFTWVDVTDEPKRLPENISLEDALKRLHAEQNGELYCGVDAFVLIWRQLQGWKLLALVVGLPIIKDSAELFYAWFADWRYKRLPYCKEAV